MVEEEKIGVSENFRLTNVLGQLGVATDLPKPDIEVSASTCGQRSVEDTPPGCPNAFDVVGGRPRECSDRTS